MTIKKSPGGRYNPTWRDMLAKGRARKRAARPKRSIMSVKLALATLKLRYCQEVSFWNPRFRGKHGYWDGGLQWVDFVVKVKNKQPLIIILDDPSKRWQEQEKEAHRVKLEELSSRDDISLLVLKDKMTSQEYYIKIMFHLRKMKQKGEQ